MLLDSYLDLIVAKDYLKKYTTNSLYIKRLIFKLINLLIENMLPTDIDENKQLKLCINNSNNHPSQTFN